MSNTDKAAQPQDFDFWEYVACSRCCLSFTPDSGGPPPVPFWVTECGHVVCNNHLKSDQSCATCGERDVQVAPLQREMEPPMANWFSSVPHAFDALAYATRFQIESLASLVRHYKRKCTQQRTLLEHMKTGMQENKELRRTVEQLQAENQRLQGFLEEPSDAPNQNGKRRMLDSHRHSNGVRTNSSPRSVTTPVAPQRLTLPPTHQQPAFAHRSHNSDDGPHLSHHSYEENEMGTDERRRPGSRQFVEQYAYNPPQAQSSKMMPPPRLTHAQTRHQSQPSRNFSHIASQSNNEGGNTPMLLSGPAGQPAAPMRNEQRMPPPPVPRAGPSLSARSPHERQPVFIPPSTPRGPAAGQSLNRRLLNSTPMPERAIPGGPPNLRSATPSLQTQRFMPGTPSGRQRFAPPNYAAGPSGLASGSSQSSNHPGNGQRMPFMPSG